MRIAIVGAGIGGLALAQGLAGLDDVEVRVYERDPSPRYRRQGYRIHIDATGEESLAAVLPADVHRRVVETSSSPLDFLGIYDSQLVPQFEQVFPRSDPGSAFSSNS